MKRLFRVVNKAKRGTWVICDTKEQALEYITMIGGLRKKSNGIVYDQTEHMLKQDSGPSLQKLLNGVIDGTACVELKNFTVLELLDPKNQGGKSEPGTWRLGRMFT